MNLLEETKIAAIQSIENYLFEIIDSIEFENGKLSDDDKNLVATSMISHITSNIEKLTFG